MAEGLVNPKSVCQIEITVSDVQKALAFYKAVFGWHEAPAEILQYHILAVPDDCPFGVSLIPGKAHGNSMVIYWQCDDIDALAQRCELHGGSIAATRNLPSYGRLIQISDPDGNRFGLVAKSKTEDS